MVRGVEAGWDIPKLERVVAGLFEVRNSPMDDLQVVVCQRIGRVSFGGRCGHFHFIPLA